jgi:exopolysaccharide biosynthesis protein
VGLPNGKVNRLSSAADCENAAALDGGGNTQRLAVFCDGAPRDIDAVGAKPLDDLVI